MTTRREFFKITLGAAALAGLPGIILQPVAQAPAVDWLRREVFYRHDLDAWQISGRATFLDTIWEYDEIHETEPDQRYLEHFNNVAKEAILHYRNKDAIAA